MKTSSFALRVMRRVSFSSKGGLNSIYSHHYPNWLQFHDHIPSSLCSFFHPFHIFRWVKVTKINSYVGRNLPPFFRVWKIFYVKKRTTPTRKEDKCLRVRSEAKMRCEKSRVKVSLIESMWLAFLYRAPFQPTFLRRFYFFCIANSTNLAEIKIFIMIIYDTRIEIHSDSETIEEEEKSALFWKSICDFSHEGQVKTMSNAWRKTTERIDSALRSSEPHSMNINRTEITWR